MSQRTGSEEPQIAVVGAGSCGPRLAEQAQEVGRLLAWAGAVTLCGGLGGVMEAVVAGAHAEGGLTVGVLPGVDASSCPPAQGVSVRIFTGMGQARNLVLVLSADAVIAVGGSWGTLSEVAMALKHGIPVVSLGSWSPRRPDGEEEPLLHSVSVPGEAVRLALRLAAGGASPTLDETFD